MKETTFSNGFLGSRIDEERSEMRYVMWIAELSESSNFWTHLALSWTYIRRACLSEGREFLRTTTFFLQRKVGGSVLRVLPFALAPSKCISWTVIARNRQIYIPLPLGFDSYQKTEVMDTLLFHGGTVLASETRPWPVVASAHQEREFNSNGLRSGRTTRWT